MDSRTEQEQAAAVAKGLATIKAHMPQTYADIQAKAKGSLGNEAFALVRRSLRGEPNCFYAIEGGHVVGAPFMDMAANLEEVITLGLAFGIGFMIVWPTGGSAHGTH
ncbi:hypothetical protein FVQ98_14590 [Ottowia sp. GY511]|uniref:Uncharacterized protein n=1 Tax=Ottowia flava TaxID=2675430 RepID=A0ABW4KQG6_9BURK|nr:hypothetical protein [Ottowia sp. GY511]TXK26382.1 hypothetical protein FVQ98_14590 [Ottowia sp. GY511]